MLRPFLYMSLVSGVLLTQTLCSAELARKNSLTPRSPLSQSSPINSLTPLFTLDSFRAAVGLKELPLITDEMIQNELDSLKDLRPDAQEAIVQKIAQEMKEIQAAGATPEMVRFFWAEDIPYISWERYEKLPGQTFQNFYQAIQSKSDEAFLAFLGLKSPVAQEAVEQAFTEIKVDLAKRIQQDPKLTGYYTPIKEFFEELEKLLNAS